MEIKYNYKISNSSIRWILEPLFYLILVPALLLLITGIVFLVFKFSQESLFIVLLIVFYISAFYCYYWLLFIMTPYMSFMRIGKIVNPDIKNSIKEITNSLKFKTGSIYAFKKKGSKSAQIYIMCFFTFKLSVFIPAQFVDILTPDEIKALLAQMIIKRKNALSRKNLTIYLLYTVSSLIPLIILYFIDFDAAKNTNILIAWYALFLMGIAAINNKRLFMLEKKSDIMSAEILGNPEILIEALNKISQPAFINNSMSLYDKITLPSKRLKSIRRHYHERIHSINKHFGLT